jgi:ribosome biogenesis GTPase
MNKRKLTRRQQWQINKLQTEQRTRSQKQEAVTDAKTKYSQLAPEQQGLVIAHYGSQVDVEALQIKSRGRIYRCKLRSNLGHLVTGDRVSWSPCADLTGVVIAREERHSVLSRPNKYGKLKPVAANIDQIVITIAPQPYAHSNLIDRYLVAAEISSIEPLLLLNKTDLMNTEISCHIEPILELYQQLGYRIVCVSTKNRSGLKQLLDYLDQRVSVFVGQSGVGKSSLINAILPGIDLQVSELSAQHQKGVHTTTTTRLFHIADGGQVIDSPGIREFGLWHIEAHDLILGFREMRDFSGHCRFGDCSHSHEPGCALQEAVTMGKINPQRMRNYHYIRDSLNEFNIHNE